MAAKHRRFFQLLGTSNDVVNDFRDVETEDRATKDGANPSALYCWLAASNTAVRAAAENLMVLMYPMAAVCSPDVTPLRGASSRFLS